jgi:GINS complex subunit 4
VPDTDVSRLKRAYVNEKCAPEILPFEHDLMRRVTESVDVQESTVAASRAAAGSGTSSATDDLTAHVYHAELNRIRFLMRAYYRTRLRKIETYAVHCLKEPDVLERLSDLEQRYASDYANIVEEHFSSVLGQMPEGYESMVQQIIEEDGAFDMVPEPDADAHVFCRVREDRGDVMLDPDDPENTMDLERDDILMIRYRLIKKLLEDEAVDLM